MVPDPHLQTEWLLTDGIGGYAMGTTLGVNTRRYHGLLTAAAQPPACRILALHSIIEQLAVGDRVIDLATHQFGADGMLHPDGFQRLDSFTRDAGGRGVRWTYHVDGIQVEKTLKLVRGRNAAVIEYRVAGCPKPGAQAQLRLRVLTPLRDFHALSNQQWQGYHVDSSAGTALTVRREGQALRLVGSSGSWRVDWQWWTNFAYEQDRLRGQDWLEDVFSPAVLEVPVPAGGELSVTLHVELIEPLRVNPGAGPGAGAGAGAPTGAPLKEIDASATAHGGDSADRRDELLAAADQFVVARRMGETWSTTVVAGYPWFCDWGRDTMISLPGLMLVPGRLEEARQALLTFARHMRSGLIPNLFDDYGGAAHYNTVDASLWFIHAVHALLQQQVQAGVPPPLREGARGWVKSQGISGASHSPGSSHPHPNPLPQGRGDAAAGWVKSQGHAGLSREGIQKGPTKGTGHTEASFTTGSSHPHPNPPPRGGGDEPTTDELLDACRAIIDAYRSGTDFGIRMDADGLITAGDSNTQLTWMDAKRDGIAFTPRYGKAVEINALWFHALHCLAQMTGNESERGMLLDLGRRAGESFRRQFWWDSKKCLHDVLVPHDGQWRPDGKLRPNQLFAVSLGDSLLEPDQQRAVVDIVGQRLLTPFGLRTLDRSDPSYRGRYEGSLFDRDAAYHQGTVWPWLMGPYCESVLRVGGFSAAAKAQVREAIRPLLGELDSGCLGQIAEVYDGDEPHRPSGCPAQAWSVAELLRVVALLEEDGAGLKVKSQKSKVKM